MNQLRYSNLEMALSPKYSFRRAMQCLGTCSSPVHLIPGRRRHFMVATPSPKASSALLGIWLSLRGTKRLNISWKRVFYKPPSTSHLMQHRLSQSLLTDASVAKDDFARPGRKERVLFCNLSPDSH